MKHLLAVALVLLTTGCITSRYQRRGVEDPLEPISLSEFEQSPVPHDEQINLEARSIERFKDPAFKVGIIEFTEEGFVNTAQETTVIDMVRRTVDDAAHGTVLVVFAHGWHHSCRTCDDNLTCFRRVLNALAQVEALPVGRHREVVGVYLGWRGRVFENQKLDYATIWNRKPVAEHIGRTGAKEVLFQLHEIWISHKEPGNKQPVLMISVGHSLGGTMLLSAIRGRLTGNIDDIVNPGSTSVYRIVRSFGERHSGDKRKALRARFGDLVVLVNPAIEAARYGEFDNDLKDVRTATMNPDELRAHRIPPDKNKPYDVNQLPIMLTISSSDLADWPNGILFPPARVLSVLNVFGNPALPRWSELAALGHYGASITHTLHFDDQKHPINAQEAPSCGCRGDWESRIVSKEPFFELSAPPEILGATVKGGKVGTGDVSYAFKLTKGRKCEEGSGCRGWDPHSPFVVISTDPTVIRDHNDIFNPVFVGFLRMYIRAIEKELLDPTTGLRTKSAY
jgi:hypothetical protein